MLFLTKKTQVFQLVTQILINPKMLSEVTENTGVDCDLNVSKKVSIQVPYKITQNEGGKKEGSTEI